VDGESVAGAYTADLTLLGSVVTGNTGCNDLIVFNSNGSITTTQPNAAGFYDSGGDDNLVGIINNTSSAITSISLSSATSHIFGFDGDGICGAPGYTFVEGSACTNIIDTSDGTYGGPWVTFSNIPPNTKSGTVNFANGGIAPGAARFSAWKDLWPLIYRSVPVPPRQLRFR